MLRERVAKWLDSQLNVTNVRPVQVRLHGMRWQGASFTRSGEKVYYLIGKRPTHADPTCYRLRPYDEDTLDAPEQFDWYVGGYIEWKEYQPDADWGTHPFGNHWLLIPWIIESDLDSQIDDYADEPYERTTLTVKEYPR